MEYTLLESFSAFILAGVTKAGDSLPVSEGKIIHAGHQTRRYDFVFWAEIDCLEREASSTTCPGPEQG